MIILRCTVSKTSKFQLLVSVVFLFVLCNNPVFQLVSYAHRKQRAGIHLLELRQKPNELSFTRYCGNKMSYSGI